MPRPPSRTADIDYAIADWRRLRASDGYAFADYARFLNANPDWPDDNRLRGVAERQMRPGEYGPTVIAFFRTERADAPAMAAPAWPRRSPPPAAPPKRPHGARGVGLGRPVRRRRSLPSAAATGTA